MQGSDIPSLSPQSPSIREPDLDRLRHDIKRTFERHGIDFEHSAASVDLGKVDFGVNVRTVLCRAGMAAGAALFLTLALHTLVSWAHEDIY